MIAILGLGFVKPVCYDVIFPFISMSSSPAILKQYLQQTDQMVLEYGVVDSPESVGFYSGTIQSMFAILNVVTSAFLLPLPFFSYILLVVPWTYASDRYGRKPVAMYGVIGMSIATATFGFSKTFAMMIITRCIGGIFSGTRSYAFLCHSPDSRS